MKLPLKKGLAFLKIKIVMNICVHFVFSKIQKIECLGNAFEKIELLEKGYLPNSFHDQFAPNISKT